MADRVSMKGFNSREAAREWAQRNISGKESHSRAYGETKGTYRILRSGGEGKQASFHVSYDRKDEKKDTRKRAPWTKMKGMGMIGGGGKK
jgi:hypothetical protein